MAEIALVVLETAGRAPHLRGDERAAVVVHLDLDTARAAVPTPRRTRNGDRAAGTNGTGQGDSDASGDTVAVRARLADGPGLPRAVVERLLCAGRFRTELFRSDGSMFDLGRSQRVVSRRLFRALLHRDGGCSHPGCGSREGLEAHHVRHWLWGGRTDLANLVLLCRYHHHSHHRDEFGIGIAPRRVLRLPPGRRPHPRTTRQPGTVHARRPRRRRPPHRRPPAGPGPDNDSTATGPSPYSPNDGSSRRPLRGDRGDPG